MNAFLVSTGVIALGEMGDKTQLLAIVLAARYRRPALIISAILIATLFNHALAGLVGQGIAILMGPAVLRWVVGVSFLLMAVWVLIPDKLDETSARESRQGYGVFWTTLIAFFIAEMGDKTQIATVALTAHYTDIWLVVAGTTLGMMVANIPAVLIGGAMAHKVPMRLMHALAALIFALLGVLALLNVGQLF